MDLEQESLLEQTASMLVAAELGEIGITPYNAALNRRMKELGLTLEGLARQVGYGTPDLIDQFKNLRAFPGPKEAQKIAGVLGVEVDELFPDWLEFMAGEINQPSQIKVEFPESEVDPIWFQKACQVEASTVPDPYEQAEKLDLADKVREAIDSLSVNEGQFLNYRFGVDDYRDHTQKEVASRFGVSTTWVKVVVERGSRKLRHPSQSRNLRDFCGQEKHDHARALVNGAVNAIYSGNQERAENNLQQAEELVWGNFRNIHIKQMVGVTGNVKNDLEIECNFIKDLLPWRPRLSTWTEQQISEFINELIRDRARAAKSNSSVYVVGYIVHVDHDLIDTIRRLDEINKLRKLLP